MPACTTPPPPPRGRKALPPSAAHHATPSPARGTGTHEGAHTGVFREGARGRRQAASAPLAPPSRLALVCVWHETGAPRGGGRYDFTSRSSLADFMARSMGPPPPPRPRPPDGLPERAAAARRKPRDGEIVFFVALCSRAPLPSPPCPPPVAVPLRRCAGQFTEKLGCGVPLFVYSSIFSRELDATLAPTPAPRHHATRHHATTPPATR